MTSHLGREWLEAGAELGFRVTAPIVIVNPLCKSYNFDALVHEFGSSQGMLLMEQWDAEKAQVATELGYGFSCLSPGTYDRQGKIEVLQDWGWSAPSPKPIWLDQQSDQAEGVDGDPFHSRLRG